jgi:HAMP domain-containing protein
LIFKVLGFAYLSALPIVAVGYSLLFKMKSNLGVAPILDYGLRDFSLALVFWILGGVLGAYFLHQRIDRSALRLSNLMKRVADGDWSATIPAPGDPILEDIACSIGDALERFEKRDRLRVERLSETRSLIRRVLELVDAPVLVIGFHARHSLTLDYANGATASAFGESLESLEGAKLESVPGGDTLRNLVETVLESGGAHFNSTLDDKAEVSPNHVADCAIVRNRLGIPTRLVVVLKKTEEEAWWRRLWPEVTGI